MEISFVVVYNVYFVRCTVSMLVAQMSSATIESLHLSVVSVKRGYCNGPSSCNLSWYYVVFIHVALLRASPPSMLQYIVHTFLLPARHPVV